MIQLKWGIEAKVGREENPVQNDGGGKKKFKKFSGRTAGEQGVNEIT